jgi:hypothetical protein
MDVIYMSNHGHFNHQYDGNRIKFPDESFTIAGISHYTENCKSITYNSVLFMKEEHDNPWDNSAIAIYSNDKQIGYVPNNAKTKEICYNNLDSKLVIINIKNIKNNYEKHGIGIRVIPDIYYEHDPLLEKQTLFADV